MSFNINLQDLYNISKGRHNPECDAVICKNPWNKTGADYRGEFLNEMYFWLEGVVKCVIAGIGVFGNIFAIRIFTSNKFRCNFNSYLMVLACFDLGHIFTVFFHETLQMKDIMESGKCHLDPTYKPDPLWLHMFPIYFYPFETIFSCASEYLIIIISLDRYFAIQYPFNYNITRERAASVFTITENFIKKRNKKEAKTYGGGCINIKKVLFYAFLSFLFSVLYCIPLFFEYEICPCNFTHHPVNASVLVDSKLSQNDEYYLIYHVIFDIMFRFVLPILILSYTNYGIYQVVKKHKSITKELRTVERAQSMMLFGVVGFLLMQNLYRFMVNANNYFDVKKVQCCGMTLENEIANMVARVLITSNSCVNFFMYLGTSKTFRCTTTNYIKSMSTHLTRVLRYIPVVIREYNILGHSEKKCTSTTIETRRKSVTKGYRITRTMSGNIHVVVHQKREVAQGDVNPALNIEE
jgi:hypothetical protein